MNSSTYQCAHQILGQEADGACGHSGASESAADFPPVNMRTFVSQFKRLYRGIAPRHQKARVANLTGVP